MNILRFSMHICSRIRKAIRTSIVLSTFLSIAGCGDFAERIAVKVFYREAALPQEQVHKNLGYWNDQQAVRGNRLDFFVPKGKRWPVLIFIHGGAWRNGDKGLRFGGADPYGNIGRFYATRGIGVAVINYRLQPTVTWREQVVDVARSMAWVHEHAENYGADKRAIFLFGHSSGAHLAARTAVDRELMRESGFRPGFPCGVVAVSGAPYDIA